MAGEKIGLTCEAFVYLALKECDSIRKSRLSIFWNEKPPQLRVVPDFTIGSDLSRPNWIVLVTNTGCTNNSQMKFWRNIGELSEAKIKTTSKTKVLSVTFDPEMKADLKRIQGSVFDDQLIVGERNYGRGLADWIHMNAEHLPQDNFEKASQIADAISKTSSLRSEFECLCRDVEASLLKSRSDLQPLWDLERKRKPQRIPVARDTFLRHGLIKAALLGQLPAKNGKLTNAPAWLVDLGILRKSIGGFSIADPHLTWVIESKLLGNTSFKSFLSSCSTVGFRKQLEKVKSVELLELYCKFVLENLEALSKPRELKKILNALHNNPATGLSLPKNLTPQNVWIFDILSALFRCKNPKSRFGYPYFTQHERATQSTVGNMNVGAWSACFMNQFFNRKVSFVAPSNAIDFVSEVMAGEFSVFTQDFVEGSTVQLKKQFLDKEFGRTLLSHRGFDPIWGLLKLHGFSGEPTKLSGFFAEHAGILGNSGSTKAAVVNSTLIKWQTATDHGKDHKTKELMGRGIACKYEWDGTVKLRQGIDKTVLVLDGTWCEADLSDLSRSGWDEIYLADEIGELQTK
jgi:hypothetical protein